MKHLHFFLSMFSLIMISGTLFAADFVEGQHYMRLKPAQAAGDGKIEVIEFFWYGCSHCYTFEPHVKSWLKRKPGNVDFIRVPAVFNKGWEIHAKAYYALEQIDAIDKAHAAIFEGIHKYKKSANNAEEIADIVKAAGVDRDAFLKAIGSFSVRVKADRAKQLLRDYQVRGVPMVAVNGQYTTSASQAGDYFSMTLVIDYLLKSESERTKIALQ